MITLNYVSMQGARHNSAVSSSAPSLVKLGPTTSNAGALPALKATSMSDSVKRDACNASTRAEELTSRDLANKPANQPDQKTLKVRIKVGSDNLSARKNAEIYSGLGLDGSPSSSLENSPSESEELSREPQYGADEYPASILQVKISLISSFVIPFVPNGLRKLRLLYLFPNFFNFFKNDLFSQFFSFITGADHDIISIAWGPALITSS